MLVFLRNRARPHGQRRTSVLPEKRLSVVRKVSCSSALLNEKYFHLVYHTGKYRVNDVIGVERSSVSAWRDFISCRNLTRA